MGELDPASATDPHAVDPSAEAAARELDTKGFKVDYVEDREGRRFGAARLGGVRLIDNVAL